MNSSKVMSGRAPFLLPCKKYSCISSRLQILDCCYISFQLSFSYCCCCYYQHACILPSVNIVFIHLFHYSVTIYINIFIYFWFKLTSHTEHIQLYNLLQIDIRVRALLLFVTYIVRFIEQPCCVAYTFHCFYNIPLLAVCIYKAVGYNGAPAC